MSLTDLMGGSKEKALPAPPTVNSESVLQAAADERKRRASAQGRASTIRTSGEGVTSFAPTSTAELLGG